MILYHVSPWWTAQSISVSGLAPARSRGCRHEVWLCSLARLVWAVYHVSRAHGCSPEQMSVYRTVVSRRAIRRRRRGVYTTKEELPNVQQIRVALPGTSPPAE